MSDTNSPRKRVRRLRAAALWTALGLALAFAAFEWLLPWLARTGNLNALVAGIVRSSFTVDVSIEKIETEPLSELTVSRLRSVSAEAKERLSFSAGSITLRYDPLELLGGRLRELEISDPEVFINLDADLDGLAKAPELPSAGPHTRAGEHAGDQAGDSEQWIPVRVDRGAIEKGSVTVRLGGRDLRLSAFRLSATRVGNTIGQRFELSAETLGGVLRAWGGVDVIRDPTKPTRFAFHSASVLLDGVDTASLLDWLAGDDALGRWLRSAAIRVHGRLRLEGSLEGTWPEEVRTSLGTHVLGLTASYGDDVSMDAGDVGLHVNASATGDFDVVRFEVTSHGSGVVAAGGDGGTEDGSVEVAGELRRREGGGTIVLENASFQLEEVGSLAIRGQVLSVLGDEPAAFDVVLEAPSIDVRSILERLRRSRWGKAFSSAALEAWSGDVRLEARIGGDVDLPRADGSFQVGGLVVPSGPSSRLETSARGSFSGLEVDSRSGVVRVEGAEIQVGTVPASALVEAFLPGASGLKVEGGVAVAVNTCDAAFPLPEGGITVQAEVEWQNGALSAASGEVGATGASLVAELTGDWSAARRELTFDLGLEARAQELLAGWFYADLAGDPLSLGAAGRVLWDAERLVEAISVERAHVATPVTGSITARGDCVRGDDGRFRMDARADAWRIPGAEAFRAFVRDPLAAASPLLEGSALDGPAALEVSLTGPLASLTVAGGLSVGPADLTAQGFKVLGLEARLPFELGPRGATPGEGPTVGYVRAQGIDLGTWGIDGIDFPFLFARRTYSFSPSTFLLHGGWVEVGDASLTLDGPRGPRATAGVRARGVDLARLTRAHRLPEIAGTLEVDLAPVTLDGRRVDARGRLALEAFGGKVSFTDLTFENVAKPYTDLRLGSGRIEGIHMDALGEAFRFGIMSGVLDGEVQGLELTAGEVTAFEGRIRAVPTSGVPQFLNRGAIESLRRVLEGPLGTLEETFFSHFYFASFGFWTRLKDGVLRLRGDIEEGGVEYILRGRWYQFPRICIINGRPGLPYDWNTIVANLRSIYERH